MHENTSTKGKNNNDVEPIHNVMYKFTELTDSLTYVMCQH